MREGINIDANPVNFVLNNSGIHFIDIPDKKRVKRGELDLIECCIESLHSLGGYETNNTIKQKLINAAKNNGLINIKEAADMLDYEFGSS